MSAFFQFAETTAQLIFAWQQFRETHDLEGIKISCCDVSKQFYAAMEAFEASVIEERRNQ